MKLLILTTATNRPEVHSESFQSYKKFLDGDLDIDWVINVDYVERFKTSVDDTVHNIKDIFALKKNVNLEFIKNKDGWMNRATRSLLKASEKYDADYVLYLEDDWLYSNSKGITFNDVFDFDVDAEERRLFKKPFIILLSKRIQFKDVTFQPTIWSKKAFKRFKKVIESSSDMRSCPETILENSYGSNIIKIQYPLFEDIGRKWLNSKGMERPKKKDLGERNPNYRGEETYREYVERCREFNTGFDVNTFTLDVNGKSVGVDLPKNYDALISKISNSVGRRIKEGVTEDDARGNVTKVLNALTLAGVEELGEHFANELSKKLYGGPCFVNHVHPYRNNITKEEAASWIWHYDDVAPGIIKILVYLTDTTKDTGAFLVLRNEKGEYINIEPSKISPNKAGKPKWAKSRVPGKVIRAYKEEGYKDYYIEGPKGTFILFNNNILHKATIPKKEPLRHCIIYNFRPYYKELDKKIGKDITWDWKCSINSKTYHYDHIKVSDWKKIRGKK
jgi:hypothetical protein